MALKIVTLNVNGLRDANKRLSFLQWLSHLSADIVCLQETHAAFASEAETWFSSFGFQVASSPGSIHSCRATILFRSVFHLRNVWYDSEGRFVLCEFSFRERIFRVCCLYAPNRNPARDDFFSFISDSVDPSVPTVVCGDFNAVFDRVSDRRGSLPSDAGRESCQSLAALFQDCCVLDIWCALHPSLRGYTWDRPDGSLSSRIDFVGCPYSWASSVESCDIYPCPFSDHSALIFCTSIPDAIPPGPGRWHLNTSILNDTDFTELVSEFWLAWRLRKNCFNSLMDWWDFGKAKIKGLAIRFCCQKSLVRNHSRSLLSNLAQHLKSKIDDGVISCTEIYHNVLAQVAELDAFAAKGSQIRSRIRWAEEGETSSSFFFRLEKKRAIENWVSAIRNSQDVVVSDIKEICSSWRSFYSELFSASVTDSAVASSLLNNISSVLLSHQSSQCDGLLELSEVFSALQGMARNKAPGSDGLPVEFYLRFWDILGSDLTEVLNSAFISNSLSDSQKTGLISLIFKKGDRLSCKNWRPITLLNVDYKLCARAIAGRLLKVLHLVVAPDQTCGVPGRFIGENVALLRDVVSFASETDCPLAILSLDQEKAFDRVDWDFLYATLSKMGFGDSFIRWVKLCYIDISSSVIVNGYLTRPFKPSRGVRQGCPLSPLLYILTMEVLAVNIRLNPNIVGIRVPRISDSLPVLSLYADDTSVIVSSDRAIVAVFDTYSQFEKASGSKLNLEKCEGLWLDSWRSRVDAPVAIRWTSIKIKVLGVFIGNISLDELNWRPRLDAVENCLASWRSRSLSFQGKALVVNALVLSRVWYVASLIHMPRWVLSELNSLCFKFFWSGKRDLVARDVVCQPRELGGFSVVNTSFKVAALLVQWVRRFMASPNAWVSLLTYWFFDRFGVSPFVVFSSPFDFDPSCLPPFYCSLLLAWRKSGGCFFNPLNSLAIGHCTVESLTCKFVYQHILFLNPCSPHCVDKFRPTFGVLYWPSTWMQLSLMPLDRKVIDLSWKISHGVLYTAERLSSFGYNLPTSCFCGFHMESLDHLFFFCPLAKSAIDWIQSLLFIASPLAPSLSLRHILFGFSADEMLCVPRLFVYLIHVCKYVVWTQRNDYRFRSIPPSAIGLIAAIKSRVKFFLPLFFKRFCSTRRRRYFFRQWGANGRICSEVCSSIAFSSSF